MLVHSLRLPYNFKKKKKEKKFDLRQPEIEPGQTDSESDVLTILPLMYMTLTHAQVIETCISSATKKKNKRQN